MKTIICDIDGTLTSLWPVERLVLTKLLGEKLLPQIDQLKQVGISDLFIIYRKISNQHLTKKDFYHLYNVQFEQLVKSRSLPRLPNYPLVDWIKQNPFYNLVYATGGQKAEALYVLEQLGIIQYFDLHNSIDKTTYPFSKKTGLPFKKIQRTHPDCLLFTDSLSDCEGAAQVGIESVLLLPGQQLPKLAQIY